MVTIKDQNLWRVFLRITDNIFVPWLQREKYGDGFLPRAWTTRADPRPWPRRQVSSWWCLQLTTTWKSPRGCGSDGQSGHWVIGGLEVWCLAAPACTVLLGKLLFVHSMIWFIYLPIETRTLRRPTPNFIDVLGLGRCLSWSVSRCLWMRTFRIFKNAARRVVQRYSVSLNQNLTRTAFTCQTDFKQYTRRMQIRVQ